MKKFRPIWITSIAVTISLCGTFLLFHLKHDCGCDFFASDKLGQIGDFYGGILGTLLTFAGLYFIYRTFSLQQDSIELAKKSADLDMMNNLYTELIEEINNLEYRKKETSNGKSTSVLYKGIDALYNFDENHGDNPNSIMNSLNGILVSFEHAISMAKKIKYKWADSKDHTLTKLYFLFYSKIIWPMHAQILQKHRENLLRDKHPNAEAMFLKFDKLTKDSYNHLVSNQMVSYPTEKEILTIIKQEKQ